MAKVLVTGATGFIGKVLCEALIRRGDMVTRLSSYDGDIANSATFENIDVVDHVYHLAARTYVPDSWQNGGEFLNTNVTGTANVLDYCRRSSASLCYVSAYIYGQPARLPIAENATPNPNNPYALSKHLAEQVCKFYSTYHGIPVTVLRPFNVYGPGQASHFLVAKIIDQVKRSLPIEVSDLRPKRDYLYIDDLIDALLRATHSTSEQYRVFNIGSGVSISVEEVLNTVQEVAAKDLPVVCKYERRYQEVDDVCADISQAKSVLNWAPKVNLPEGIHYMIYGRHANRK